MNQPQLPRYGEASLADLLPSLASRLGVPGGVDALELPQTDRYLLVLVDGLGSLQLHQYADQAPGLAALANQTLTAAVPSTTATSLTSLGTGLPPGRHGIAGYSFWLPEAAQVLNTLRWPADIAPVDVQPQLTWFERLSASGVRCSTIAPAHFAGSGMTQAALRGPTFWPVDDEQDHQRRIELAVRALAARPGLAYFYERGLDHAGHEYGVGSEEWLAQLSAVDDLVSQLRGRLDPGIAILVTGDHGMVNVPGSARLIVEDVPGLLTDVTALAGEGRLRQLHTLPGQANRVAERWSKRLGDRAWVRTREQAGEEGWFGEVSPRLAARIGDVLIAMADDGAVLTRTLPKELNLVGMHGSLTAAEMLVPLLNC